MIRIGIHGASGKMGRMIEECLKSYENLAVVGAKFDKDSGNLDDLFKNSDVIIDFSSPRGTQNLLNFAIKNPKPLCIGTTGLDEYTRQTQASV